MDLRKTITELRSQANACLKAADALEGLDQTEQPPATSNGRKHRKSPRKETCGKKLPNGRICKKRISPMGRNGHSQWHERMMRESRRAA